MRLTELTDSEILLRLDDLAQQHNIRLSFAHKRFYVSLLHLAEEAGEFDEDAKQYFVELSVTAFVERLGVSHTTVAQALKLLNDCGAIRREKHKRAFRKLPNKKYVTNGAYRTYINAVYLHIL